MAQQPNEPDLENLPENIKNVLDAINVQAGSANFEGFSTDDLREAYDWMRRLIAKKIDEGNGSKIEYESQLIKIIHDEVSARWNEEVNRNEMEQRTVETKASEIEPSEKSKATDTPEISELVSQAKDEMKIAVEAMDSVVRKTKPKAATKKKRAKKGTSVKGLATQRAPVKEKPKILGLIDKAKKDKELKYQINIPGFKSSPTIDSEDGTPEILKLIEKAKGEMSSAKGLMQKIAIKKGRGTMPRRPRGRPKTKVVKNVQTAKLETKRSIKEPQEEPSIPIPKIMDDEIYLKAKLPPIIEMPKEKNLDEKVNRLEAKIESLQNKLLYLENTVLETSGEAKQLQKDATGEIETTKPTTKESEEYDFAVEEEDEFLQLSSIIKKLRSEREIISTDIYNMKTQYNSAKLRFERLAKSLEYAKLDLIENVRQSKIYSKIREIDNLKKSLQHIKDDLASAGDSGFS